MASLHQVELRHLLVVLVLDRKNLLHSKYLPDRCSRSIFEPYGSKPSRDRAALALRDREADHLHQHRARRGGEMPLNNHDFLRGKSNFSCKNNIFSYSPVRISSLIGLKRSAIFICGSYRLLATIKPILTLCYFQVEVTIADAAQVHAYDGT